MQMFVENVPGTETRGNLYISMIEGMGVFRPTAEKIIRENGIGELIPDHWYPYQPWLLAIKAVAGKTGPNVMRAIGRRCPENARWPPEIDTIEKALAAIDKVFHMSNRIGAFLYNPQTGVMREGIGHFFYKLIAPRKARMVVVDHPVPCALDQGVIESVARHFKPTDSLLVEVTHDDSLPCCDKGADSCTYYITW